MSLSFEEFSKALERSHAMDQRLQTLLGFNPSTCNHYGVIQLYNQRINANTTDEEIMEIRAKYLKWKQSILDIFENSGSLPSEEQFDLMFCVDGMYGTLFFLGIPVDIDGDIAIYREKILECINL